MRSSKFIPQVEGLEAKVSLSGDVPIQYGPVTTPTPPVTTPGIGNPDNTTNPPAPTSPPSIWGDIIGFLLPPVVPIQTGIGIIGKVTSSN